MDNAVTLFMLKNRLTPWSRVFIKNLSQVVKKSPAFYGPPKVHYRIHNSPPLITILSQINPVHTPHPAAWRPTLILFSHLRQGFPNSIFPPTKTLYAPLFLPISATYPAHLNVHTYRAESSIVYVHAWGYVTRMHAKQLCSRRNLISSRGVRMQGYEDEWASS